MQVPTMSLLLPHTLNIGVRYMYKWGYKYMVGRGSPLHDAKYREYRRLPPVASDFSAAVFNKKLSPLLLKKFR